MSDTSGLANVMLGGILTVADDLLKNDGKKFIDMMEQLAERRMQREEVAAYNAVINPNGVVNHGHALPVDDEAYDEEEDEDDYDSAEDEEEGTYEDDLVLSHGFHAHLPLTGFYR